MSDIFKMPKLGETVTTGTVTRWLVAVGDTVGFDDPLLEVSTDKVDSEIPSPFSGVLLEIMVPAGETAAVGAELARIGPPEEAATPTASPLPIPSATAGPRPLSSTTVGNGGGRALLSPIVRQLAARHGIDLSTIQGSGAAGRIMREDVEAAIARTSLPSAATVSSPVTATPPATAPPPVTAIKLGPRDYAEPLSRMRLVIGERMAESLRVAPHVWTSVEVDMQAVEEVRRRHQERFRQQEGTSLTYLAFIARVTCDALRKFPVVNSTIDLGRKTRILHHYVNLGIAVDLAEQGLVVPVIRDADRLNLRGLAHAIRVVADKASDGTYTNDDLSGSTFTITNPGPAGDYA